MAHVDRACLWPGFKTKPIDRAMSVRAWTVWMQPHHGTYWILTWTAWLPSCNLFFRHRSAHNRLIFGLREMSVTCSGSSNQQTQPVTTNIFKLKWQTKRQPAAKQTSQAEQPACQTARSPSVGPCHLPTANILPGRRCASLVSPAGEKIDGKKRYAVTLHLQVPTSAWF